MIAAWMLYCVAITVALVAAGYALERGLHLAGRPTRWAWVVALAGSLAIPTAAWFQPDSFATVTIRAVQPTGSRAGVAGGPMPNAESIGPATVERAPGLGLAALDSALRWAWAVSSGAGLLLLATAALRLALLRRRWRVSSIDGRTIWVSENVGPAVIGLWPGRVVVPSWVLSLDAERRRLVLTHEVEHARAGDPWVLAAGTVALALAPWNVAIWWLVRRLRLAVEIDCDARVLRRGARAPAYGDLLLQVGRRRSRLPLGAPALGEPRSFLEHRIRRLSAPLPSWRWLGSATGAVLASLAIVAACEAPRPVRPEVEQAEMAPKVAERIDSVMVLSMRRIDSLRAERLRPWVRENLQRHYPELLRERAGPRVDVWLGHDSRLRVWQVARTAGTSGRVDSERIGAALPAFRPGWDAWGVVSREALQGLVRDNVRVIWAHLPRPAASAGSDQVFSEAAVDERPELMSAPPIRYPGLLKFAGIQGVVLVEVIVDTAGRAEPRSLKVISSPHVGFDQAALSVGAKTVFRPARINGRAVRVQTLIPIRFTLPSDPT